MPKVSVPPPSGNAALDNWLRDLVAQFNASGARTTVTLTDNDTTTVLTDARIGYGMHLTFTPLTANAAAAMDALHYAITVNGQATLTHDNTADTDRTFSVAIVG